MENTDTVKLLKECDAGTKMAVDSIEEILDKVCDSKFQAILQKSLEHHKQLQKEIEYKLASNQEAGKEPNPVAKSMSWLKTNMKMTMDECDKTVADLITDGCNMGVKSLHKYLNQYQNADNESKKLCKKLADIEEQLCRDTREYL